MFRPYPILTAVTVIAVMILLGLGTWQMQRREEKHALLAQIAQRQATPPAPVEYLFPAGDYATFRTVTAQGRFTHALEAYVFAPRDAGRGNEPGYRVVTPFVLTGGDTILVDRGWVPEARRDPATRKEGQVTGVVGIEGVLQRPARGSAFTPPPDEKARIFFARNSMDIARVLGLRLKSRLILEATAGQQDGPDPLPATEIIPDNHLGYALTWYGLAIALIAIYLRYHFVQGRLRFGP